MSFAASTAIAFLALTAAGFPARAAAGAESGRALVFCCRADNDVFKALPAAVRRRAARFDEPAAAVAAASRGAGVLLLADGYPDRTTALDEALFREASRKDLRLFVEYPDRLPGPATGAPRRTEWERAVVASDVFGPALPALSILGVHDCRFVPAEAGTVHLVVARVAGFDKAVYGLPEKTHPLLFEARPGLLVATAALSRFVTARYAPASAWTRIWEWILDRVDPGAGGHRLEWQPVVAPAFGPAEALPAAAEGAALRRGVGWYTRARMLVHPSWAAIYDHDAASWTDRVGPMPGADRPSGDGSLGVLEGFNAAILHDGTQRVRWWRRNDCNGEVAGTMALAGRALKARRALETAARLGEWLYERSIMSRGKRADPANPAYGLISWNDVPKYWKDLDGYGVYYGDDNARSMLGMMAAAGILKTGRWDARLARCLLANLRLTSRLGFQPDRIDEAPLEKAGWRSYFGGDVVSLSPHYQGYLWACFLRAFASSGFPLFFERALAGIQGVMAGYPALWTGPSDMQMARARMLLPLAWLVRVDDTPEHRGWLRRVAEDMLKKQDRSGAIGQDLPGPAMSEAPAPASNEAYGTAEAPLIQTADDPCADLLYATNFAFLGLREAAAATGDTYYREAEDRLAGFLCRAQVRSPKRPELDGAWFRAFDFRRWEYWASNADAGWGAWAVESGWTQSWIVSVLALRRLETSLWDVTAGDEGLGKALAAERPAMIPDELLH